MKLRLLLAGGCICLQASLGGCAFVAAYPITSVSLGTWGVTGKSPVDHAASGVTDQDCEWFRIFEWRPICQDHPAQPAVLESQR